jgi:hypothetical protein
VLAEVSAQHGWEFGDGLDDLYCDCGWTIDAYIDYEDGLPERDSAKAYAGDNGRELAAVIRHRAHVSQAQVAALAAANLLADPAETEATSDKQISFADPAATEAAAARVGTTAQHEAEIGDAFLRGYDKGFLDGRAVRDTTEPEEAGRD